jgi:uncharacterized membrane protein
MKPLIRNNSLYKGDKTMKRAKNYFSIGLAAVAALALVACGGGGGGPSSGGGNGGGGGVGTTVFSSVELQGLGGGFSAGVAINNAATPEVVGIAEAADQTLKGVSWTISGASPSAPTELSPLAGNTYSAAYGVNDGGVAVGESGDTVDVNGTPTPDRNTKAVFWSAGAVTPTPLSATGLFAGGASAAYGVNSAARIVGEAAYNAEGDTVAVTWAAPGADPAALPHLFAGGSANSSAYFVGADGTITGESRNADGRMQAVVWIPGAGGAYGAPVALTAVANQVASVAFGIDQDGRIAGEAELNDGVTHGIVWNDDGTIFADLGANTAASGINNADRIVGYTAAATGDDRAAVWNAADTADFQNLAAAFSQVYGVNDNSQIVGISGSQAMVALPQ